MRHRHPAALVVALVLALAAFTGSALAGGGQGNGGGNGNGNANGHDQQQATPQTTQPAPASESHGSSSKQSDTSASNPATGGSNAHGVKPSSTTKHDTYAKASSDKTKQYGNGKTAGQIATQAGYGDATLHGPGNSQPHKTLCGGHEVDVHALKHKGSKCGAAAPSKPAETHTSTPPATPATPAADCGTTTKTVDEKVLTGVMHKTGHGYVLIHPSLNSAHYTGKHEDDIPQYAVVEKTIVTKNAGCPTQSVVTTKTVTTSVSAPPAPAPAPAPAPVAPAASAPVSAGQVAAAHVTQTPAATPAAAGGVKGATATLMPKAKPKPAGGVLGATTRLGGTVASTNLPFTGLPLWIFVAVAAALILVGATVRRSAHDRI